MKLVSLISFTLFSFLFYSQHATSEISDSSFIRSIYTTALTEGNAYEDLRFLCKEIGARITGSTEAQMAISNE